MSILDQIKLTKMREVSALNKNQLEYDRLTFLKSSPKKLRFEDTLKESSNNIYTLITEIKKASPSKGIIREDFNPCELAISYEKGGASCLSVLTDVNYFKGSNEYISQIKEVVSLPILRKEFLIDPLQAIESKNLGADCILIIIGMNSIEDNKLIESMALDIGLECILEVHSLEELEATKHFSSNIIGINNRDLNTFITDIETTIKLLPHIPKNKTIISESGLSKKSQLERLAELGVSSFLVGETLMKQNNVEKATKSLLD
ncbi:indole-3-glycerol phosphate synthase TrpC [Paracoccaceae bacterium]|nr:indole-3-glycerol phosphate synthase TrpC [Paracoccaceae bacterium]